LVPWLIVLAAALPCAAEVRVSLPLEGYYRAGRYMPVRVVRSGEPTGEVMTLSADGAVPTMVQLTSVPTDAIVPLLVVTEPLGPITWSLQGGRKGTVETKLTALGLDDRLVGYAGGDASAAAPLFPGKTVIPVPLDLTQPLRGPLVAWETLDAAVIDALPKNYPSNFLPAGSGTAEYPAECLAAGGSAIVLRSPALPMSDSLPWHRTGDAWVLFHDPLGPRGVIAPEAYEPTYGWHPGRPPAVRRQVVLIAVLFTVLVVAATLWRSRFAVAAVAALCAAACGALAYRASHQSPVTAARGVILVRHGDALQSDEWEFYKSMAATTAEYRPAPMARPVFASAQHYQRAGLRLWCDPDGQPILFTFPLTPQTAMAFLTRSAVAASDEHYDPTARGSPLWPLVREGYLRAGVHAAGEVNGARPDGSTVQQEVWRGIVVVDE
jgi:hypothetical protein